MKRNKQIAVQFRALICVIFIFAAFFNFQLIIQLEFLSRDNSSIDKLSLDLFKPTVKPSLSAMRGIPHDGTSKKQSKPKSKQIKRHQQR
jgi:hypothetical protein